MSVATCDRGSDLVWANLSGGVTVSGYLSGVMGVTCIVMSIYGSCCCK